jgi:serine/threonine protein kinase
MFGEAHLVDSPRGPAVLKLIRTSTREGRNKALQEAVALAQLPKNSGHLLEVFDFFEEENGICLIVNHCSGGTIQDLIQKGQPMSLTEVSRILYECAAGLRLLHEWSPPIIHRDIKPDNIFLDATSRVQIGDFGLARVADDEGSYYTFGCQPYMAPELKHMGMSTASDMWALGCVGVCLLTGQTMEYRWRQRFVLGNLLSESLAEFLEPILNTVRGLPLETVIRGLLAFDPQKRLTSCDVLRLLGPKNDQSSDEEGSTLILPPVSPVSETSRHLRGRKKKWIWLSVLGAVGLGTLLVLQVQLRRHAPSTQRLPVSPPKPKATWIQRKILQALGQVLGSSTKL